MKIQDLTPISSFYLYPDNAQQQEGQALYPINQLKKNWIISALATSIAFLGFVLTKSRIRQAVPSIKSCRIDGYEAARTFPLKEYILSARDALIQ